MIIAEIEIARSAARVKMWNAQYTSVVLQTSHCEAGENLLPVGACGLKVKFSFLDSAWGNLSKTAVFRSKNITVDAAVIDNCATIPHEVLVKAMDMVEVGVYGTDSTKNMAIPTVWAKLGVVASAANPSGRSSAVPTLPYWAQIKEQLDAVQNQMMDQDDLQEALLQMKESGAFDGPQGVPGEKGDKGDTGVAGYSPIKGVDYWTVADRETIVTEAANIASKVINSSINIISDASGDIVVLRDSAGRKLQGLTIYGKTIQNGTPTPDAPVELETVGADGSIDVTVCGKNLFDPALLSQVENYNTYDANTGLWTTSSLGSWSRSLLYNAAGLDSSTVRDITKLIKIPPSVDLTVQVFDAVNNAENSYASSTGIAIAIFDENGLYAGLNEVCYPGGSTFHMPDNAAYMDLVRDGNGGTISFSRIQIEVGSTATEYEPYKVETLSISTPNGLNGIPVTSGGNYTDENGRHWICDEVDLARGKYVRRVGVIESYSGESISSQYMSSTGALTTGAKVLYVLDSSNEHDLTAEELAQYSALHTNYPNTTIYNDEGAEMLVIYFTQKSALPVNVGSGAKGKVLSVDEHGCVVPKSVTEMGAAPSGYGYGGIAILLKNGSRIVTEEELNTELALVYDTMAGGETKLISCMGYPSNSDWRWFGTLSKSSANNGSFVAHSAVYSGTKIVKTKYNGAWRPIEWENPPMIPNEEYRTTERLNGKPVYQKMVSYFSDEALVGDTKLQIPHGIANLDTSLGVEIKGRTASYQLPFVAPGESTVVTECSTASIALQTTGTTNWKANRTWYFDMKYVKTN